MRHMERGKHLPPKYSETIEDLANHFGLVVPDSSRSSCMRSEKSLTKRTNISKDSRKSRTKLSQTAETLPGYPEPGSARKKKLR